MIKKNSEKTIELFAGERIDDLQYNVLKIIQNENLYCFSSDSVLLCNFVKTKATDTLVDLCSGSGIVGILSQAKNNTKKLIMIEKQSPMADMCKRSLELNQIKNAEVFCADVKDAAAVVGNNCVDVVCCNPPYYLTNQKKLSGNKCVDVAKFEIEMTFEDLCKSVNQILKYGGSFYFVNDSERIAEILSTLKKYKLEPKKIEFVYTDLNKASNVVLIKAVKYGKPGAKVHVKIND